MRKLLLLVLFGPAVLSAQSSSPAPARAAHAVMDHDLTDVSVDRLHELYREHRYTVTEVVQWHLDRIARYNGVYRAVQTVTAKAALTEAGREDVEAKQPGFRPEPLWGVPIVIKANTSIAGLTTTAGWIGYMLPGHELVAPRDAPIVARLRKAGAILVGVTNMPDFAASDTTRSTAFGRTGNAYDVRFSPGGSSGGTVTAVTSNLAVLGNGTDTGNSIRMPVATSNLVGIFPTRGLVSIAGIAPLDWQLDNTGPIARTVADAALALTVLAGEDPLDPATIGSQSKAQPGPYTQYLKPGALKGKRFAVPAFILDGETPVFQGVCPNATPEQFAKARKNAFTPLKPETRAAFLHAVEELRAAGATVLIDSQILPDSFAITASHICTLPYLREGTEKFLADFGPAQYHSAAEYEHAVGKRLPSVIIGGEKSGLFESTNVQQATLETDPHAGENFFGPRDKVFTLYEGELDRLHLDGFVYPAIQMPPVDETMPQDGRVSEGPHSDTNWVNMLGVPAISFPAGFYEDGLPFGIEISTRKWHDGDLIGWAYDYEQHTHYRRPPVLVDRGLLPTAARPLEP
ncbi:amidase [Granulicella mallensis]|uniref:Asp-tRNA(Asn)/Glu-tRNA(Gln) amidotransferase A subunit family amidase n=1 Tax=Granulicella mallensis TaxID=940614 RepID=A0A7W8EBI2_9BACT|nr:amidase [Granulicella mallensis]MBB5066768.1 Asp-tRNA(Asn)/Glu-tRNA(Gln) amidotransferase A subunit family amidase [Granulicella mallensis]